MSEEKEVFNVFFDDVFDLAKNIYMAKRPQKGDTWQTCDIEYLERELAKKLEEYRNAIDTRDILQGSLDILNFALMIAARWAMERRREWGKDIR